MKIQRVRLGLNPRNEAMGWYHWVSIIVSFRQACMNRIQKNDTIGCPTIQRRITDGIEKLPNPTTQSQRSQRAI